MFSLRMYECMNAMLSSVYRMKVDVKRYLDVKVGEYVTVKGCRQLI